MILILILAFMAGPVWAKGPYVHLSTTQITARYINEPAWANGPYAFYDEPYVALSTPMHGNGWGAKYEPAKPKHSARTKGYFAGELHSGYISSSDRPGCFKAEKVETYIVNASSSGAKACEYIDNSGEDYTGVTFKTIGKVIFARDWPEFWRKYGNEFNRLYPCCHREPCKKITRKDVELQEKLLDMLIKTPPLILCPQALKKKEVEEAR